jgi:Na+-translocating ferredoxin:NAD+ oxidoreductase RNF subunit RnfB
MQELQIAAAVLTGLCLALGAVLALASKYLRVDEDPRIDRVTELLPGSNCGACGSPGCRAFAERLVAGTASPSECTVASTEEAAKIAALLGVDVGVRDPRVARLHCAGGRSSVRQLAEYAGPPSCASAALTDLGGRACAYGCLGFGDCAEACDFDAIEMNDEGLPVVAVDACTACGDCVDACPLGLFSIEPLAHPLVVQCASPLEGDEARESCAVACDACGRCAMDAPAGAIEMHGGLPVIIDADATTPKCTYRCPTGAIVWLPRGQFDYDVPLGALTRRHG